MEPANLVLQGTHSDLVLRTNTLFLLLASSPKPPGVTLPSKTLEVVADGLTLVLQSKRTNDEEMGEECKGELRQPLLKDYPSYEILSPVQIRVSSSQPVSEVQAPSYSIFASQLNVQLTIGTLSKTLGLLNEYNSRAPSSPRESTTNHPSSFYFPCSCFSSHLAGTQPVYDLNKLQRHIISPRQYQHMVSGETSPWEPTSAALPTGERSSLRFLHRHNTVGTAVVFDFALPATQPAPGIDISGSETQQPKQLFCMLEFQQPIAVHRVKVVSALPLLSAEANRFKLEPPVGPDQGLRVLYHNLPGHVSHGIWCALEFWEESVNEWTRFSRFLVPVEDIEKAKAIPQTAPSHSLGEKSDGPLEAPSAHTSWRILCWLPERSSPASYPSDVEFSALLVSVLGCVEIQQNELSTSPSSFVSVEIESCSLRLVGEHQSLWHFNEAPPPRLTPPGGAELFKATIGKAHASVATFSGAASVLHNTRSRLLLASELMDRGKSFSFRTPLLCLGLVGEAIEMRCALQGSQSFFPLLEIPSCVIRHSEYEQAQAFLADLGPGGGTALPALGLERAPNLSQLQISVPAIQVNANFQSITTVANVLGSVEAAIAGDLEDDKLSNIDNIIQVHNCSNQSICVGQFKTDFYRAVESQGFMSLDLPYPFPSPVDSPPWLAGDTPDIVTEATALPLRDWASLKLGKPRLWLRLPTAREWCIPIPLDTPGWFRRVLSPENQAASPIPCFIKVQQHPRKSGHWNVTIRGSVALSTPFQLPMPGMACRFISTPAAAEPKKSRNGGFLTSLFKWGSADDTVAPKPIDHTVSLHQPCLFTRGDALLEDDTLRTGAVQLSFQPDAQTWSLPIPLIENRYFLALIPSQGTGLWVWVCLRKKEPSLRPSLVVLPLLLPVVYPEGLSPKYSVVSGESEGEESMLTKVSRLSQPLSLPSHWSLSL